MKRSSLCLPRVLACGLVVCVALFVPASAGQKGAAQKKKETQESAAPLSELDAAAQVALKNQKKATKVFTNSDLRQLGSGAPPRADAPDGTTQPAAQPAQDLLKQMFAGRDSAEARRRNLAAAQKELTEAQNRVTQLEKRLLSVRNPFMPRQRPAAEAAGDWSELDAKQRAKRSEEELEQARKNVQEVRQRIARLR